MLKEINTTKGFHSIQMTRITSTKFSESEHCTSCGNKRKEHGMFILALGEWHCMSCYQKWYKNVNSYYGI